MSEAFPLVYFGGPDRPARCLRDLLQERVEATPSGGEIVWATYYLRDRALAKALIAASDRGVRVTLRLEGAPRFPRVNDSVIAMLEAHGLGGGLRIHRPGTILPKRYYPYWHSKIYCFSHPEPTVLVGSLNPSGDEPEDAAILADIGDQDRGHNLLVEFRDGKLARLVAARVRALGGFGARFRPKQNLAVRSGASTLWFFPRLSTGVIDRRLASLGSGDRLSGVISHLKRGPLADALAAAARRGADVNLLVHDTERRVRGETLTSLGDAGVTATRYVHPAGLPLHAKFLIIEKGNEREAWFGSLNFNRRSLWLNHELLVGSREPAIVEALTERFRSIADEAARLQIER